MNPTARSRARWLLLGYASLAGVVAGCQEKLPPAVPWNVAGDTSKGPPSAATGDMKTLIVPSGIEPPRERIPVIDYGPPSAASTDAANARGR